MPRKIIDIDHLKSDEEFRKNVVAPRMVGTYLFRTNPISGDVEGIGIDILLTVPRLRIHSHFLFCLQHCIPFFPARTQTHFCLFAAVEEPPQQQQQQQR